METQKEKKDVYSIINDQIIKHLEKGTVPWKKPWTEAGFPTNMITEKPYRGLNVWLLASLNYPINLFLTLKQLNEIGGEVIEGEKPHIVVYWKKEVSENTEKQGEKKTRYILRYYKVYNIDQCAGIPKEVIPVLTYPNDPIFTCEEIVTTMQKRPKIVNKYQGAYYHPIEDYVNMPKLNQFKDVTNYYVTLFHELIHSTGHKSRLNRKELVETTLNDKTSYSVEELIAELGASYLSSKAGIISDEFKENANYIAGWLKVLKNDRRFIVTAAALAQRAVDFILNVKYDMPVEHSEEVAS